ncbi:hypothetical protein ACFW0P_06065 [Lysobacter soli]|uniref:hypothetical protein n=1 Tax=Lysobacter soli TaxID=453783 RepID=UPI0036BE3058
MAISAEACHQILREMLARRPDDFETQSAVDWFADAAGIVSSYNSLAATPFNLLLPAISNINARAPFEQRQHIRSCKEFVTRLRALYAELSANLNAYATLHVDRGQVFTYFDEVRNLLGGATNEVLFIDPYIDAEFVSRYLPQIHNGVAVRLLSSEAKARELTPALELYRQQTGITIEARVLPDRSLHDRHLIVDGRDLYHSGASFKDGARNAPTSINQIVDAATEIIAHHQARWATARAI